MQQINLYNDWYLPEIAERLSVHNRVAKMQTATGNSYISTRHMSLASIPEVQRMATGRFFC